MRIPQVRFTMWGMMRVVGLMAVFLAVTRFTLAQSGTEGLTSLAVCVFAFLTYLPQFLRVRWPMFWLGFAGSGLIYLSFVHFVGLPFRLPTSLLLDWLHDHLAAAQAIPALDFNRAGHAALSLVVGLLGGCLAALMIPAKAPEQGSYPPLRDYFPTVFAFCHRLRWWRR